MPQQTRATPRLREAIEERLRGAIERLREAIEEYRTQHNEELDEHADKVLSRLADSSAAAEAFDRLKPKDDREVAVVKAHQSARTRSYLKRLEKGNAQVLRVIERQLKTQNHGKALDGQAAIIRACIQAETLARIFPKRVKKAKEILKRRRKPLRKAVATLRGFLNEIISEQQEPPDPLWVRPKPAEDVATMGLGLATFERWIEYERHVAELNLFRLRASRKSKPSSKTLSAGQIAAIGRLADEVKHVTGRPHCEEIADLADAILKVEVSAEQVRDTQRPPVPHWQWAVRSLPKEMRKRSKAVRSRAN